MARANAAHVYTRVDKSTDVPSVFELARPFPGLKHHEPLLRRGAIGAFILFMVSLVFATGVLMVQTRSDVISDAIDDLDMLTTAASRAIALNPRDDRDSVAVLTALLPARLFARGRQIHVADRFGAIVASLPASVPSPKTMSDLLGPAHPLIVLADKAGVMRFTMADGTEALASVRNLDGRFGQIAMVHPLPDVLADWRAMALRAALLLGSTALLLSGIGAAYWWQAERSASAEEEAEGLRRRIDTALSRGRCGLWDWDIARGRIYWSPSMYDMLGMPSDTNYMSFGELRQLIHPSDADFGMIAEQLASSSAQSIDQMFRIRNAAGDWVWLRARAEITNGPREEGQHLVGIAIDVTEQHQLEERTAVHDARLRDAIETISEAFVLWDADNCLALCNSKFRLLHGIPQDAPIVGHPYLQVMSTAAPPLIRAQVAVGERAGVLGHTYEAQLSDGRWLQVNERRTGDGGYVSVGTDITTLKRHEEQLMDSERRLMASVADLRRHKQMLELQAQELAVLAERYLEEKGNAEKASRAKSEFLANMSHELRTPLNAILGFSEMMQAQVFGALGSERYVEYCKHIRGSGEKLLAVITDVLDMSRLDAGQMEMERSVFPITDVLVDSLRGITALANEKHIVVDEKVAPAVLCHGDQAAVARSVSTVLRNAIKFTPTDGRISVRLRSTRNRCVVTVADTGCGVPADCIERIGRPFEQFAPHMQDGMKGSGLGLAIASSLIKLHGGAMRIRSTEGRGTVVRISLPSIAA